MAKPRSSTERPFTPFPRPEALVTAGVAGLRAIKFSTRKSEYIVEIARGVAKGSLDLEGLTGRPADEVVAYLTAIRGVGPWTAQWLLIRALGRPDGFPHGDLALQRFLGRLTNDGPFGAEEALGALDRLVPVPQLRYHLPVRGVALRGSGCRVVAGRYQAPSNLDSLVKVMGEGIGSEG